jgi:LSD1 subclass zinc finger protein
VPISDADVARCVACGSEADVPAPYRMLRDAVRLGDDARARAEAIAFELARPPSFFMRFWITAGRVAAVLAVVLVVVWLLVSLVLCIGHFVEAGPIGALIMLIIGIVLGIPLFWDQTLHGLAGPLGTDYADVWGGGLAYGLLGLSIFVVTVVPLVLAAYAESFEAVRTALRTALAAKPAATPGGPAECRTCGAPLDVPADALSVRCMYCTADNLVHLDATRLATVEQEMKVVCTDLESAIAEERTTAGRGRKLAIARLGRWLTLVPACILLGWAVASLNENDTTFWHRAVASTPMIPKNADNPTIHRDTPIVFDVQKTFDVCNDDSCLAYYFVALDEGETPELVALNGDLRLTDIQALDLGPWYNPTYQWLSIPFDDGAPHAGWYRVALTTARELGPAPQVRWDVSR